MRLVPLREFKDVLSAIRGRKRLLCLDVGTKNVGIAISDESLQFAFPHSTFHRVDSPASLPLRMDPASLMAASRHFQAITDEENIGAFVIGLPLFNGEVTPLCREIVQFASRLAIKLHDKQDAWATVWDESYSTSGARHLAKNMSSHLNVRLKRKDMMAASIILEDFMKNQTADQKSRSRDR